MDLTRPGPGEKGGHEQRRGPVSAYLSLFASFGTLVCCALPSLLVMIGFGTTVAATLSAAPWLVALSRHKEWVFLAAGLLLVIAWRLGALAQRWGKSCPPDQAEACRAANRLSRTLLVISTTLYAGGAVVAFLLGPVLTWLDR